VKILIVDDSRAMRMIVARVLRQANVGKEIVEAADGVEALAVIRASQPDLVLCDWNMPEMNGIDLLRALRAEGRQVPFGFVTSESTTDMREQAIAAGALFLVAKPFTAETLTEVLTGVV
jgi:two-component system, chemotaxis family, chemotaxis protein CheY